MRIALVVGAAFLLLSGNVMHADTYADRSNVGLKFAGVNAVQNPSNPDSDFLDLEQVTYSGITTFDGGGYYDTLPDGSTATAPSTLYITANGGPDSTDPYTLNLHAYATFTASGLTIVPRGPDAVQYFFTGSINAGYGVPALLILQVNDDEGAYSIPGARLYFTPEPSSFLLAVTGSLCTVVVMRRRYTFPSR